MALSLKKNTYIFVSKLVQHTWELSICCRGKLSRSGGQRNHIELLVFETEKNQISKEV